MTKTLKSCNIPFSDFAVHLNPTTMDALLQQFYDYVKKKYGVLDKEGIYPDDSILCSIPIIIPGFRKNLPAHTWQMHLETGKGEERLIIGEIDSEPGNFWSRYIEIMKQKTSPKYFLSVVGSMYFENKYDFKTLRVFTKVVEDFFKQTET